MAVLRFRYLTNKELDTYVKVSFIKGRPGWFGGPPERCREPEPDEMELISVEPAGAIREDDKEEMERLFEAARHAYEDSMEGWE